jgi:uncharacterized membrane protein YhaH (DUF805 family)
MPDPGWYDDPQDPRGLRWWDGTGWTDRRQPRDAVLPPPASAAYGIPLGGPGGPSTPPGTPPPTPPGMPSQGGWDAPPPPPPSAPPAPGAGWSAGSPTAGWSSDTAWPAPPRSFTESIQICFRKYVDFTGRASRSEYWYFALFTALVGAVTGSFSESLSNAAAVATLLPSLAVGARRLHDIGRSGWNQLWFLLPFIGWIIIIVRLTRAGDPGPNAYG